MRIFVFVAIFVPMVLETVRSARNERAQRARGGIEPPDDVYPLMRIAYPAAFISMIGEEVLRGAPRLATVVLGSTLFAGAKALKWWAILSLGEAWTFRVIVVPGATLVTGGPYRFMRHPNYVGVVGELVGAALMTGATVSGPLASVAFIGLLWNRIAVEERAVDAILRPILPGWSRWPRRPDRG